MHGADLEPGAEVLVTLVEVDRARRRIRLELVPEADSRSENRLPGDTGLGKAR
ncbi:hypothetical protein OG389_32355 [Streptomyces sp. NBC_00435]|uniref:hypothetical protein n=1 Tax=Streptomyces sp. NBC_00435 TaxID=2903649 RepID=UPI002E24EC28